MACGPVVGPQWIRLYLVTLFENIPLKIKKREDTFQEEFVVIAKVSGDVMMCRRAVAENRTIGEKGLR